MSKKKNAEPEVKIVKISALSLKGFWTRPFFMPSFDKQVERYTKQGWRLVETTPVAGNRGKTRHFLLKFER